MRSVWVIHEHLYEEDEVRSIWDNEADARAEFERITSAFPGWHFNLTEVELNKPYNIDADLALVHKQWQAQNEKTAR